MILTYYKQVSEGYCEATDEYDGEDIEIECDVDNDRIDDFIVDTIYNDCNVDKEAIYDILNSYDLWEHFYDILKDEIYDYFRDEVIGE